MTNIVLAYDRTPKTLAEVQRDLNILHRLREHITAVKLGIETINARIFLGHHETTVAMLMRRGTYMANGTIIWDAKLHDIGNTMAKAALNLAPIASGITIHASASESGLSNVVDALKQNAGPNPTLLPILFGVTVLDDIDDGACSLTYGHSRDRKVLSFARKLTRVGINGILCSPEEFILLREEGLDRDFTTMVYGTSPSGMTHAEAAALGADFIVIEDTVVFDQADPLAAIQRIKEEIERA